MYGQESQSAAADARGDAIVAWDDGSANTEHVGYAYRSAGGNFGAPQALAAADGDTVEVAMNDSGVAVVTWREGFGAHGAVIDGSSATPRLFAVSSSAEYDDNPPVIAGIDRAGDVDVFWSDQNGIWYSAQPAGGTFATPKELVSPSGQLAGFSASVAANGQAVVAWSDRHSAFAAYGTPASGFVTTELESNTDPSALYYDSTLQVAAPPETAMNATGQAVVSWLQEGRFTYDAFASTLESGQMFGRPQLLGSFSPIAFGVPSTIDPAGHATVVWSGSSGPDEQVGVYSSTSTSDGAFAAARPVAAFATGFAPCEPAVTSDGQDNVYVVWNEYDAVYSGGVGTDGCQGGIGRENAAVREAGASAFGPVTTLASAASAFPPVITSEGSLGALAAWPQGSSGDGSDFNVDATEALTSQPGPPENISPPTVTGDPVQGATLTEAHGNWTGGPTGYSYQWQDCNSDATACSDIAGSTGPSYTEQPSDVGQTIRVQETALNPSGTSRPAFSAPTATVHATASSAGSGDPTVRGPTTSTSSAPPSPGQLFILPTPGAPAKVLTQPTPRPAVWVRLRCAKPRRSHCSFFLVLSVAEIRRHGKVTSITANAPRRSTKGRQVVRIVILGTERVTLPARVSRRVRLTLNATGTRMLAARHSLHVMLTVTDSGAIMATRQITFKERTRGIIAAST